MIIISIATPFTSLAAGESNLDISTTALNNLLNPKNWMEVFRRNISLSFIPGTIDNIFSNDKIKAGDNLNLGVPGLQINAGSIINLVISTFKSLVLSAWSLVRGMLGRIGVGNF